ncbi:hypothetical protein DWB77_00779 [Streptomyces hundungensis]|uniref:HTH cro/C1-type domain-containing protein n=1 Tax=Streptomyces hundungensis TaxID=1077946 RepID=A0A387H7U6_9ACTN|nr:hypothetical protein [Streptomyces hundungensis]AYG78671.1 hypothetical protein DWB77_00779 [Streptomyces hundungensis]
MCPTHKSPLAHPLSLLRRKEGLSHSGYARLVALKHAELGFGGMAARREKVARWESGKVTPELTAQFTIAQLHGVPRAEVLRLGWPHWLHLADGPSVPLCAPWTVEEALRSLRALSRSRDASAPAEALFPGCTTSVDQLIARWQEASRAHPAPLEQEGRPLSEATVAALEDRHLRLRRLCRTEEPATHRVLADTELRMVTDLLHTAGYGPELGARLASTAARAACLSGRLAQAAGDLAHAQASYVTALRVAALVPDAELAPWVLVLLAAQQIGQGAPANAPRLLAAAGPHLRVPARTGSPLPALMEATLNAAHTLMARAEHPLPGGELTVTELDCLIRDAFAEAGQPTTALCPGTREGRRRPAAAGRARLARPRPI